jgi:hypothetical protein
MTASTSPLTPAIIMDLRTSVPAQVRCLDTGLGTIGVPFILHLPADDLFALHAYGLMLAVHADPRVLGECLRQERAEPGFIRRILDPREDVLAASLDPKGRAVLAAQRRMEAAKQADYARSQEAAIERRTSHLNLTAIGLDDL